MIASQLKYVMKTAQAEVAACLGVGGAPAACLYGGRAGTSGNFFCLGWREAVRTGKGEEGWRRGGV